MPLKIERASGQGDKDRKINELDASLNRGEEQRYGSEMREGLIER